MSLLFHLFTLFCWHAITTRFAADIYAERSQALAHLDATATCRTVTAPRAYRSPHAVTLTARRRYRRQKINYCSRLDYTSGAMNDIFDYTSRLR